jgi:hypothetical protein
MSSGHIPNSFSLPFGNFLKTVEDAQTGAKYTVFRERSELDDELRDVLGQEFMRQALNDRRRALAGAEAARGAKDRVIRRGTLAREVGPLQI